MNLAPINRRQFIKLAATLTGSVALANSMAALAHSTQQQKYKTDFGTLLLFNNAQAHTIYAFAEAILPTQKPFPSIEKAHVVNRLDEEMFFVEHSIQAEFKMALDAMEMLPTQLDADSPTFSKMTKAQRLALLQSFYNIDHDLIRAVTNNIRMLIHTVYYGHESSWQAIGYDGPFSGSKQKISAQRKYYKQQLTS